MVLAIVSQPAPDKLTSARLKVERAKDRIADLEAALRAFGKSEPYRVRTKHDPDTRKLIYYLASVEDVPAGIPLLAGEAIHGLRSALDHLAYQLFLAGSGPPALPAKHVSFPLFDSAKKYKTESPRKVKGMRQDAINAIDAIQPYRGGAGEQLWVLHELDNADKHRLLIAVGSAPVGVNFDAHISGLKQVVGSLPEGHPARAVILPSLNFPFPSTRRKFPLEAGDELLFGSENAKPDEDLEFTFEIVFNETGVVEGKSLIETLYQLADLIDDILTQFVPLL